MNLEEKLAYVAEEVKKVEEWAKENRSCYWYEDYHYNIVSRLLEIKKFAKENEIPFLVSATEITDKNYDSTDGYSEEESSSYYEELESSEYEEDEDEEDEDTEESNY
jgi:hypothetical protein